jgi:Tol biopolymer transport system component
VKRLLLAAAVPLTLFASACAAGDPLPTTYVSDTGATLNADVYSNFAGDAEYWWRYGTTTGYGAETPHHTIAIADDQPHPVSQPVAGLTAGTTYHFQLCTSDDEENPPRVNCQTDRTFTTRPAGGQSGIVFTTFDEAGIWTMNPDGSDQTPLTSSSFNYTPEWSPDGTEIAFASNEGTLHFDIWVMNADGSDPVNITNAADSDEFFPDWSPDGSKILFESDRDDDDGPGNNEEIYVMDRDGGNQTRLTTDPALDLVPSWSPDGRRIAFDSTRSGDEEIWVMNANGSDPVQLTTASGEDEDVAWSPDGTKLAFVSWRDGPGELWVMNADGSDQHNVIEGSGQVNNPTWSPDGSRIAFERRVGDNGIHNVWAVDADGTDLVELTSDDTGGARPDWSPRP